MTDGRLLMYEMRPGSISQSEQLCLAKQGTTKIDELQFSQRNCSVKALLHDAESVESLGRQIAILQNRLKQSKEENSSLKKQLLAMSHKSEQSSAKLAQLDTTVSDTRQQLEKLHQKYRNLKLEKAELQAECQRRQEVYDDALVRFEQLRHKARKLKKREVTMRECCEEAEARVSQTGLESQKVSTDNKNLRQEIEDLKFEIQSITTANSDLTKANEALRSENTRLMTAFSSLEDQVKNQSSEIAASHKDRQNINELLRKMYAMICSSESLNTKLQAEIDSMVSKKGTPISDDDWRLQFSSIEIPFSGALGDNCRQIMNMGQFTAAQRIQRVLTVVAHELSAKDENLSKMTERVTRLEQLLQEQRETAEKSTSVLKALLRELKNLAVNETKIDRCAFCEADQGFIQFVAEKCVISSEQSQDDFVPSDFFCLEDISRRKAVIERYIKSDTDLFALFTAQFLANTVLRRQLQKTISGMTQQEDLEALLTQFQCRDLHEIVVTFQRLHNEVVGLQEENRALAKQCRSMKKQQQSTVDIEARSQIQDAQTRNDELQHEVKILELRNHVLTQQLQTLQQEQTQNSESSTDLRVCELEDIVRQKQQEIERLQKSLEDKEIQNQKVIDKLTVKNSRQEKILFTQIEQFKVKIAELESKLVKTCKKHRAETRELIKKNQEQHEEMTREYEQAKLSYDETIKKMEEKIASTRELSQKLLNSVSEKERVNQKLAEEASHLRLSLKSVDMKLTTVQEEAQKERQLFQAQITATKLSCQSQIQDLDRLMKKEADNRVKSIFDTTLKILGDFYRIDQLTMDDESFKYLLSLVQRDLGRLKLFQTQGVTMS